MTANIKRSNSMQRTFKDILFVAVQFIILVLFFVLPAWGHFYVNELVFITGWVVAATGILAIVWASINLGRSISPFPTPLQKATLITNGIFKYVRHPIYTGFLLLLAGLTVSTGSFSRIVITLLAVLFFSIKASYEEEKLIKKYPGYPDYKERTGKFIPKLGRRQIIQY